MLLARWLATTAGRQISSSERYPVTNQFFSNADSVVPHFFAGFLLHGVGLLGNNPQKELAPLQSCWGVHLGAHEAGLLLPHELLAAVHPLPTLLLLLDAACEDLGADTAVSRPLARVGAQAVNQGGVLHKCHG